jgi:ergothioneine biosynthesis protein EgtB
MLTQQPAALSLLARFRSVRAATMEFCRPLSAEDMMVQSCAEASPVKWHLAHTSWFFETFVLSEFVAGYKAFDADFRWLFNSYYKALGEMPEKKLRASFSRPALERVLAYRAHVDAGVERLLATAPEDEALRRIVLGLEHEQQHLELAATDIKHAFFTNPLQPAYAEGRSEASEAIAPPLEWVAFTPELTEIGVTPDASAVEAFAFDNETPRHKVYIAPFRLASRLVTCAEYLAFVEEEGYTRPELWLSEGWDAMREQGWQAPLYWKRDAAAKAGWSIFTLQGWRPLEEMSETPVCHVSFFEADAYARWAGWRLPTEFEWEVAAEQGQGPRDKGQGLGGEDAGVEGRVSSSEFRVSGSEGREGWNMLETGALHPVAARCSGLTQMFGDVWEWTASPYTGYPGYKPLPGALGEYNGKFMSSQMELRGGSCVTPREHIRATYRNFFHPGTRWQFSGLRLARDGSE